MGAVSYRFHSLHNNFLQPSMGERLEEDNNTCAEDGNQTPSSGSPEYSALVNEALGRHLTGVLAADDPIRDLWVLLQTRGRSFATVGGRTVQCTVLYRFSSCDPNNPL